MVHFSPSPFFNTRMQGNDGKVREDVKFELLMDDKLVSSNTSPGIHYIILNLPIACHGIKMLHQI